MGTTNLWQLSLFGTLELVSPDGTCIEVPNRKPSELIAFLALHRQSVVSRDVVCEALWPDVDALTARNRLKATLSNLKTAIPGFPIISHGKQFIELSREQIVIDYEVCERQLKWRRALGVHERQALSRRLLEIVRGRLLPGFESPWVIVERARYDQIAETLTHDIGNGSSVSTESIRLGDEFGGVVVPLVGREAALRQVNDWLNNTAASRTLHIVGTPGVGKTRLLKEALSLEPHPFDIAVTLSTVQKSETNWLERLGGVIEVREPDRVAEVLAQFLSDFSRPLLVIDDVDQGANVMSAWLFSLMRRVPRLRLLATARRHPRDAAVEVCELAPFSGATAAEGIELLTRFAHHFGADKAAIGKATPDMAFLSTLLEGLPLALEIAGAWLPIIRPQALLRRLEGSPDLLMQPTTPGRDSLYSLVATLLGQLDENDQQALLRLSVCQGGCGEKLAEELLGDGWVWRVRTLTERSLALRSHGRIENRFLVIQALREAVKAVAGPERTQEAELAWRDAVLRLSTKVAFEINERDRQHYLSWLRDEGDNVIAACLASRDHAQTLTQAIEIFDGLRSPFWLIGRDRSSLEAQRNLQAAGLKMFPENNPQTPSSVVVRRMRDLQAEKKFDEAVCLIAEYRKTLEPTDQPFRLANALDREGDARLDAHDLEGAKECWEWSSRLLVQIGRVRQALWNESKVSHAERALGRIAVCRRRLWAAMERAEEIGDLNSLGVYFKAFACEAQERGNWELAEELSSRALSILRELGESITFFDALIVRSGMMLATNRYEEALPLVEEARAVIPDCDAYRDERLRIIEDLLRRRANGPLVYKHLVAEH